MRFPCQKFPVPEDIFPVNLRRDAAEGGGQGERNMRRREFVILLASYTGPGTKSLVNLP